MRVLIICLALALTAAAAAPPTPTPEEIEEILKIDHEPYLKDEAKWKVLFDCFMDRGPCGDAQKMKDLLLPVLASNCEKCTPSQKTIYQTRLQQFAEKYPKDIAELTSKLSPNSA